MHVKTFKVKFYTCVKYVNDGWLYHGLILHVFIFYSELCCA